SSAATLALSIGRPGAATGRPRDWPAPPWACRSRLLLLAAIEEVRQVPVLGRHAQESCLPGPEARSLLGACLLVVHRGEPCPYLCAPALLEVGGDGTAE